MYDPNHYPAGTAESEKYGYANIAYEIRLQQAKKLLRRKEISITQVALRCGFNSSSHLSASFQRVLHMTPSEYRKLYCEI